MSLLDKKIFSTILSMIAVTMFFACTYSPLISKNEKPQISPKEEYVKDEVIVKFKEGIADSRINEINASLGCETIKNIGLTKTFLIKIKTGKSVKEIIDKYKQFEEVEYAQPNYIKYVH